MKEILTEYELIVDSYEQVRERPRDNKEQEKYYSGKASKHTFKTQIIILPDASDIVDVIAGEPGPKSDITLFRENRENFDPKQKFKGDLGYLVVSHTNFAWWQAEGRRGRGERSCTNLSPAPLLPCTSADSTQQFWVGRLLGEDLIDTPIKTPRNSKLTIDQKK
ncbi:transposase family protein [Nostoc sp.]|uniref:transposase family protein n=1 Tax=Nostoc sp. TaxID=1180 RepID=UPI002FFA16D3